MNGGRGAAEDPDSALRPAAALPSGPQGLGDLCHVLCHTTKEPCDLLWKVCCFKNCIKAQCLIFSYLE